MSRRVTRASKKTLKGQPSADEKEPEVSESDVQVAESVEIYLNEGSSKWQFSSSNSEGGSFQIGSLGSADGTGSLRKRKMSKTRKERSRSRQSSQPRTPALKRKLQDLQVETGELEEYEVDYILNKRVAVFGGDVDYLVKWKNYSERKATWEPFSHVEGCIAVEDFEKTLLEAPTFSKRGLLDPRRNENENTGDVQQDEMDYSRSDFIRPENLHHRGVQTLGLEKKQRMGATILREIGSFARSVLATSVALVGLSILAGIGYVFVYDDILLL